MTLFRSLPAAILGMVLFTGVVLVKDTVQGIRQTINLQSALSTCFRRAAQSYTAFMTTDGKSVYLSPEFLRMSKDCYGDLVSTFEAAHAKDEPKIKSLRSDTLLFLRELEGRGRATAGDLKKAVSLKYSIMESTRDEIATNLEASLEALETRSAWWARTVFACGGLLLGLSFMMAFKAWSGLSLKEELEHEALRQVQSKEGLAPFKVEGHLRVALERMGLLKCLLLFTKYHANLLDREFFHLPGRDADASLAVRETSAPLRVAPLPMRADLETCHLSSVVSRVVGQYAERIFTVGAVMEVALDESLVVMAPEDGLREVLSHLFRNSLRHLSERKGARKISIKNRVIGGTAVLQFMDTGGGFSPDVLQAKNIFENVLLRTGTGMNRCRKILDDCGGRINFENVKDPEGRTIGAKVGLILKLAEKAQPVEKVGTGSAAGPSPEMSGMA